MNYDPYLVLDLPLWKRDGSHFISDDQYGHLITNSGSIWTPDGRWFDGVDDNISCGSSPALNLHNDFTMEAWIKTNYTTTNQHVLWWGAEANGQRRSMWIELVSGYLLFSGYGVPANIESAFNVADGRWHYCVITLDSHDQIVIYVDGEIVKTGSPTLNTFTYAGTYLGAESAGALSELFKGTMKQVRITRRVFPPQEVSRNYLITR